MRQSFSSHMPLLLASVSHVPPQIQGHPIGFHRNRSPVFRIRRVGPHTCNPRHSCTRRGRASWEDHDVLCKKVCNLVIHKCRTLSVKHAPKRKRFHFLATYFRGHETLVPACPVLCDRFHHECPIVAAPICAGPKGRGSIDVSNPDGSGRLER